MSTFPRTKPAINGRNAFRPFVVVVLASSILPFLFWPSLLTRAASADFLPHRFCYLDSPQLIWVNVISDVIIGLAYIAISATLAYLVRRARGDIPFSWMFLAFGLFIVACGFTHIMEVITVWRPFYWLSADVKIVTAAASLVTAFSLPYLVPKAMGLAIFAREQSTLRQQLERANIGLVRLEEISSELASRVATGMVFWDRDILNSTVQWSGNVQSVYGLRPEDMQTVNLSSGMSQYIHPDDQERVKQAGERAVREHSDFDAEFRIITPSGKLRWIMGRGSPIYNSVGEAVRMVGVNMDVTNRRLADEAMQRSEKLAITGRMAATVAHEINNPLSAVMNLNYLIAHNPELSSDIQQLANLSMRELERIGHIVQSTLAFHRGSADAVSLDLCELMDSAVALYQSQFRARGIEIERICKEPVHIVGIANDLRQVFANLVSNASDILTGGGKIRIRITSQGNSVRIDVVDSGPGIDPAYNDRLFEPFFTTKGERGTGLGLWVTAGIVQKYGGAIRLRTRFGGRFHGTKFIILLPIANTASVSTHLEPKHANRKEP
ncbi:MAG TPA: PAS domain-containing sensor histidine kinase [Candidatus Saccharimonadales bacterium]|nr:PAS domain-containing sensor histidine kinase [Candidatus Saccharimonadales bacterium]